MMLEVIKYLVLLIFLATEGIRDFKWRKISVVSSGIFGVMGVVLQITDLKDTWIDLMAGMMIGAVLLVLSKITSEKIGYGDGIVLMVTGIYLGFSGNFMLLSLGMLFSSAVSIVLLILRKATKKTELPFVSFMFGSYFIMCVNQLI